MYSPPSDTAGLAALTPSVQQHTTGWGAHAGRTHVHQYRRNGTRFVERRRRCECDRTSPRLAAGVATNFRDSPDVTQKPVLSESHPAALHTADPANSCSDAIAYTQTTC